MDILEILKKGYTDIADCDLDYYTQELETGDYDDDYVDECLDLIEHIKIMKYCSPNPPASGTGLGDIKLNPQDIVPTFDTPTHTVTPTEQFFNDLLFIRKKIDAEDAFKKYVESNPIFTDKFIDDNFNQFISDEIRYILEIKQLPETTLEKYFVDLDKTALSRYQLFSEDFFMKHYDSLSVSTILKYSQNPWRKKENRSKKLDVFLKLKGVI